MTLVEGNKIGPKNINFTLIFQSYKKKRTNMNKWKK